MVAEDPFYVLMEEIVNGKRLAANFEEIDEQLARISKLRERTEVQLKASFVLLRYLAVLSVVGTVLVALLLLRWIGVL